MSLLWGLLKTKPVHYLGVLLVGAGLTLYAQHRWFSHPVTTTVTVHDASATKEVKVEVPVLTTKVVTRIVQDPKQAQAAKRLLAENAALKIQITSLISMVADLQTTGGTTGPDAGTITVVPSGPVVDASTDAYSFKDWQLSAKYSAKTFSYSLDQKFNIVTTTGKDSSGNPVSLSRLFQVNEKGALVLVPSTATAIFSDTSVPRWMLNPRLQGGFGIDQGGVKGGFIGLQWLTHGKSPDPRDSRWSAATPGVFVAGGGLPTVGGSGSRVVLLPVEFNLGTVPGSPFSNLWFSPFIDTGKHVGFLLTASF